MRPEYQQIRTRLFREIREDFAAMRREGQLRAVEAELARRAKLKEQREPSKPLHEMDPNELHDHAVRLTESTPPSPTVKAPVLPAEERPLHELADDELEGHAGAVWDAHFASRPI